MRIHLPPSAVVAIEGHGQAIRQLQNPNLTPVSPDERTVAFSYPGPPVIGSVSSPIGRKNASALVTAFAYLGVADEADDVVLEFRRNGAAFAPVGSGSTDPAAPYWYHPGECRIPAGARAAWVYFTGAQFAPNTDELTVAVTACGAGASALTVRTDWTP